MPDDDANPSAGGFDSMRQVVARLRAMKAEALIELHELDQAIDEVRRSAQNLLRAAHYAHTNIEQLARLQLIGEEAARALSRNSRWVTSAAEQLDAALNEVRAGLDDWAIAEASSAQA